MTIQIVRRIAEERENSQLVPSKPRTEVQRVRLYGLYELLIVLRIVLTLNLQTGWIHQDELSNSIEVVAGDYFDLQVFKPSGFNTTFPTQSITLLHATIYFPYLLANHFLTYEHPVGKEKTPNAKLLILLPRIVMLLLSFLLDYIMVKFCGLNGPKKTSEETSSEKDSSANSANANTNPSPETHDNSSSPTPDRERERERRPRRRRSRNLNRNMVLSSETTSEDPYAPPAFTPFTNDYSIRLVTLASSQVILIFSTRTHSSSINTLLFASLLYLVSASFHAYDEYIPILERYYKLPKTDGVGKTHLLKRMKATGFSPINRLHWIALITVVGLFNDPEFFISYACIPLFFYMQRGISNRHIGMKYFHARIFAFLLYFFSFSIPFILWDSFYYGKVTPQNILDLNLSPESFVITPVNYFATKTNQFRDVYGYLKIFGLYIVVFNILGVMGFVSFMKEMYDMVFAEWRLKPNLDSHWTFLNCSLFLPLFFLIQAHGNSYSVFDLSPLIFPLVYMHGYKIPLISRFSSLIGFAWFACNCFGVFFFGYASQGGILTSFLDLYDNLTPIRFNDTQIDVTFSQMTAIPPTFTLAIPSKWKTILPASAPNMDMDLMDLNVNLNGLDTDEFDDPHTNLPPSLRKTVLKLEHSSKVRVYHTGFSPLPMSHLERDLHRLVHKQDIGKDSGDKISFLLIPYVYGRESEESFKLLKLSHVKTYWNHVSLRLFSEDSTVGNGGGGPSYHQLTWSSLWGRIVNNNSIHFGLSLYRMEKIGKKEEIRGKGVKNDTKTKMEETFYKYFQFHDAFYDFVKYGINICTGLLTGGLFLTSFLVYLT